MRKVVIELAMSLDGMIEGPNGEYDWCFTDQDYGMTEFAQTIDATLMGRKTYEVANAIEGDYPWRKMKTYLFSRTIDKSPAPNVEVMSTVEDIRPVLEQPGKDLWLFGGADLTAACIEAGLVDVIRLSVHPIVLGKGKPLFGDLKDRLPLKFIEQKTYNTGLVSLKYEVIR